MEIRSGTEGHDNPQLGMSPGTRPNLCITSSSNVTGFCGGVAPRIEALDGAWQKRVKCGIPCERKSRLVVQKNRATPRPIRLRGVRVHNLKHVDLDIARGCMTVFCGVSGSGKTSLALDTLYAEGQRRYIESFSAYTRQFLQRLDRPEADSIDDIPPAVAVTRSAPSRSNRSTVATATEIADYMRLLYAKVAELNCYRCGQPVRSYSPGDAATAVHQLPPARLMVGFPVRLEPEGEGAGQLGQFQADGFVRVVVGDRVYHLANDDRATLYDAIRDGVDAVVLVDRLKTDDSLQRLTEAFETAQDQGQGTATAFWESSAVDGTADYAVPRTIDGVGWKERVFSKQRRCMACGIDYDAPEPRLFSFNHPLGACPTCEGFGDQMDIDEKLIVPDGSKTLREGAIAPWNSPSYRHELTELMALADDYEIPLDVPYKKLNTRSRQLIREGVPERNFGGLNGFFAWLERKKYKMHVRVFLSRWRSYRTCSACQGKRLKPEALAYHLNGLSIAALCALQVDQVVQHLESLELDERRRQISDELLEQICSRLGYLKTVGLGYLTLDRTLRTLSGGEAQRVSLTTALGSNLVNMLYVLDEPTAGLHPRDVDQMVSAVSGLRNRGNTVVVVEHDEQMIRAADCVVEVGPGAGTQGGTIVFKGTPSKLVSSNESLTGDYLAGRRTVRGAIKPRRKPRGFLELTGARGHNLKNIAVEFPLGVLCLVTGVSGSGKSTLVQETLYGALCKRKRKDEVATEPFDDLVGAGQIEDVMLIDQSPIGRSPRSNPVTYAKAFDPIRNVFAETVAARTHNYTAGYFSFNSEGGRCETCQGDGCLQIDMQFLADMYMKCPDCQGTRYRKEILAVRYRDRNIAEVLEMTVRQAYAFFRGHDKVLDRLKRLMDVGLDYLRLGQSAKTLSSGEAQRLKLAAFLASATRRRTLFILDEPTTGLHFSDIVQLLECFEALLEDGHSLVIVEHHPQLMLAADWIIDLGPGAAEAGGTVVAAGAPEQVAEVEASATGQVLKTLLPAKSTAR